MPSRGPLALNERCCALQTPVSGSLPELAREALASTLRLLQVVDHELQVARAKIVIKASARESVELAASMPGIDDYLGFIITSALGDIERFKTAESLPNYAGLTPTLRSSGTGKPKHGRITKRGSKSLRWAIEAAKNAVKPPGRFRNRYAKLCKKGKGRSKALVAIANDLLTVLWHVLTNGERYRDVTPAFQQRKDKRREKQRKEARKTVRNPAETRQIILDGIGAIRNTLQSMAA